MVKKIISERYRVGKYDYPSKIYYQRLLFIILSIFFFLAYGLFLLKDDMNFGIFFVTLFIDISTQIHLLFRYLHSKDIINYDLNEL